MNLLSVTVALLVAASTLVATPAARGGENPPAGMASAFRDRLLGKGWESPDTVRLRWFGVAGFVASFGGHVVLLDAWVPEGTTSGYVPLTVNDLIGARPEYIYVGHGHFDHMAHAGEIAEATGAKIVGTLETCATARAGAAHPDTVPCVPVLDRDNGQPMSGGTDVVGPTPGGPTPWGAIGKPAEGPPGLRVTVVRNKHSGPRAPDPANPRAPVLPPPDPGDAAAHPPSATDEEHFLRHAADPEGGALAYRFTIGGFTLTWHDTAGPLANPGEPGAAAIKAALESLGPSAVELGAIWEFHQATNGLKDAREYAEAIRPKVFVPLHHDNALPPVTTNGRRYYEPLVAELSHIPKPRRPYLCFITDPENYQAPLSFAIAAWAGETVPAVDGCYRPH